jgi:hypothetical protein
MTPTLSNIGKMALRDILLPECHGSERPIFIARLLQAAIPAMRTRDLQIRTHKIRSELTATVILAEAGLRISELYVVKRFRTKAA